MIIVGVVYEAFCAVKVLLSAVGMASFKFLVAIATVISRISITTPAVTFCHAHWHWFRNLVAPHLICRDQHPCHMTFLWRLPHALGISPSSMREIMLPRNGLPPPLPSRASTHISYLPSDSTRLKARLNCSVRKPHTSKRIKSIENIHISIQNSAAAVKKVSGNWLWRLPHALRGLRPSRICILEIPCF